MTAEQVAEFVRTMREDWAKSVPPPAPPDPFAGMQPDDVLTVRQAQKYVDDNVQNRLRPLAEHFYNQNLGIMRNMARSQYQSEFQRWGKEIDAEIDRRKTYKVIDASDFEEAVTLIRGRHVEELATERAKSLYGNVPVTEGAGGGTTGGSGAPGSPWNELPDWYKEHLREAGVNERSWADWCERTGQTPQQFAEMMKKNEVTVDRHGTTTYYTTQHKEP